MAPSLGQRVSRCGIGAAFRRVLGRDLGTPTAAKGPTLHEFDFGLRIPGGPRPRGIVDPGNQVWILHADLTFEAIRISEEDTQHRPKIGDEVVSGSTGRESL